MGVSHALWFSVMVCLFAHCGALPYENATFVPDDINATFVGETVLQIQPPPPEIDLAGFSMQHISSVQAFVRSGSQFIEPLLSFIQGLFSGGRVEEPRDSPVRGFADRRKILMV